MPVPRHLYVVAEKQGFKLGLKKRVKKLHDYLNRSKSPAIEHSTDRCLTSWSKFEFGAVFFIYTTEMYNHCQILKTFGVSIRLLISLIFTAFFIRPLIQCYLFKILFLMKYNYHLMPNQSK